MFHSGSGAGYILAYSAEPAPIQKSLREDPAVPPELVDYGPGPMEPKTERMYLPQWYGDPTNWREYQQEVRLYKTGENLGVNWSVAARLVGGLEGSSAESRSGDD